MQIFNIFPADGKPIGKHLDFSPVLSEVLKNIPDNSTIYFNKGEYHFWPENAAMRTLYISNTDSVRFPEKYIGMLIENKKNLVLTGDSATLIFHGSITAIAIVSSENISISNLKIDYACPSVIDMKIKNYKNKIAQISILPCYTLTVKENAVFWESEVSPYTQEAYWSGENGLDLTQHYHAASELVHRTKNDLFQHVSTIQKTATNSFQIEYACDREMESGDFFQTRHTHRDTSGIFFSESLEIQLENLHICYLYSMGIIAQCCKNLTYNKLRLIPDTPERKTVSAADMLHFSSCSGKIKITDCEFSNPHDDPINVHGTFLGVEKIEQNTILLAYRHHQTLGFKSIFPGEWIQFYNSDSLLPVGNPIEVLSVRGPKTGDLIHMEITVNTSGELPCASNLIVENISRTPDVVIENNSFQSIPTRGILVSSAGEIQIQNNFFSKIYMACIFISCDGNDWYESGPVKNILIKNNRFSSSRKQVVLIEPTNSILSEEKVHENVCICKNEIHNMPLPYFSIKSSKNVQIHGNQTNLLFTGKSTEEKATENINSEIYYNA